MSHSWMSNGWHQALCGRQRVYIPSPVVSLTADGIPDDNAQTMGPKGHLHVLALDPEWHFNVQHHLVLHLCMPMSLF